MPLIAPSILSADFANLERDCRQVFGAGGGMVHFDVMDGVFVPNLTVGAPVLQSLKRALPHLAYDVHLMILRPAAYVDAFAKAGATNITFHLEAESNIAKTIELIHRQGCKAGLSLRPGTPLEALLPHLPLLDQVLVMSVEPGFGGQAFHPGAPQRIRQLRGEADRSNKRLVIEVDGGINAQTAPLCLEAGADVLVAGSAVFGAPNPAKAMTQLLESR